MQVLWLVREAKSPFSLQVEGSQAEAWGQILSLTLLGLKFAVDGDTVHPEGGSLDEVDYWEVDPDWDGVVFRSAAQAMRPLRDGGVTGGIKLPGEAGKVCGRVVDSGGKMSILMYNP